MCWSIVRQFAFLVSALLCCHHSMGANREIDAQPNIVVIFTDDQGYGDLSCFGSTTIRTPRIDSLLGTAWLADGKTITTGLAGAYVMVEVTKLALGVRVKTGDGYALPLAAALAVGRWGCFFNGCCYGVPTQLAWGVDFIGDGLRHPTQIYESLFHAAMAMTLWYLADRDLLRFQRLKFYLIAYCSYRFATEFIRPEPIFAAGLTFYQWFTLVFAMGLALQWNWDRRLIRRAEVASSTNSVVVKSRRL